MDTLIPHESPIRSIQWAIDWYNDYRKSVRKRRNSTNHYKRNGRDKKSGFRKSNQILIAALQEKNKNE